MHGEGGDPVTLLSYTLRRRSRSAHLPAFRTSPRTARRQAFPLLSQLSIDSIFYIYLKHRNV